MKKNTQEPAWLNNLRVMMACRGFNPRSLSLKAGLNATAVRDMLEGRARFPRYDTVESLAKALGITPAQLMAGEPQSLALDSESNPQNRALMDDDLNLLTEIITRLQETAQEHRHNLKPQDFAAMVTSLFRQMNALHHPKGEKADLMPHIQNLLNYETLRRRTAGKK